MASRRTVDLLPEIFRTQTNRKFLAATLDQLTQEPNLKKTQGYVGRRVGPGVNPQDNYVVEPTVDRNNYQLEPGVCFLKPDTSTVEDAITYPGIIDALSTQDAITNRQDRLFESQYYSWDPFCDFDKFTNYSQYYWLPAGPDSVDVSSTVVPLTDDFTVTRSSQGYAFTNNVGENPILTLARGGTYTFTTNQLGHEFWIQATPGVDGRIPSTPNISSRDVLGVVNNGEQEGTVTFNVPLKTAQDFYYDLPTVNPVNLITDLHFDQINNVYVSAFMSQYPQGIDGITNLNGRTVIFTYTGDEGWEQTVLGDPFMSTPITDPAIRYSVWRINYELDDEDTPYMVLSSIRPVAELTQFQIDFGTVYSSTSWYKDSQGYFKQIPLLTAIQDTLYYQDSTDPLAFGQIQLIDLGSAPVLNIDNIIGAKNYTSPNGVTFTNGLKVQFRGSTYPTQYEDVQYYVEGVGTGPGLDARVGFINGEAYFGPFHTVNNQKVTGLATDTTFQQYIYDSIEESLANPGAGAPIGAPLPTTSQAGAALGAGIKLIPVSDFVTPEIYTLSTTIPYDSTRYDSSRYDATLNSPIVPDYLTINRASRDQNAWSRSNRWFHIDVIRYTAELNNQVAVLDNNFRGKRPIIEFRDNLKLFNYGTQAKQPVNIIDFSTTDALSNINGQTGYSVQGYKFIQGTLVIFANDTDPQVRNTIYSVNFIDPDGNPNSAPIINLTPVVNSQVLINECVLCLNGINNQGITYWFDGTNWNQAQEKTSVNQAPLFDLFDAQGTSFGDSTTYPSTNFLGSRLFGYAVGGTTTSDEILGFALEYLNIDNVGDIVFDNYLYTDTFTYVENNVGRTLNVSTGFAKQYIDRVLFSNLIGWLPAAAENRSRQVFRFVYDGSPLILDIPAVTNTVFPAIQMFIEGIFVDPTQYTVTITDTNTTITFTTLPLPGVIIEVQAISDVPSQVGFYQVPLNLSNNPLNENSTKFTLGTIRTHYETIGQNLKTIVGRINGPNNTRDLGNIVPYGTNIVQQSSPLALTSVFLRSAQFELFKSLDFNSQEYQKFKAALMDLVTLGNFVNYTPTEILDQVIQEIGLGRTEISPFYWSDMIPATATYSEDTYTYTNISTNVFDTRYVYNFNTANYRGLLVYLNGELLLKNYDYTVGVNSPTVTITVTLSVGDVITIREYNTTYGTFVPNTPTKLGLYPAFKPEIFYDETYVKPTLVIQGHDGSITVAFGDIRDQVLLEFEKRIFDNLKISSAIPLGLNDVCPGQFRTTEYSPTEINQILRQDFLKWVGWNKLDYTTQSYIQASPFTYNYSQSANKLTNTPLLGAWRGIYNYFYDTITPNTTPWEMLGFSEEPSWWQSQYGPAPYTSGNLVLWDDLANGLVNDPNGAYVRPAYIRSGLLDVIPVDSEGRLLNPLESVVGNFDATSFRRSWAFGDDGPVENVWRTSSAWPFAVMRLLALTKPAKFFSLFADRDRYKFDAGLGQYLWDGRYRLNANELSPLYGNGTSRASYIDWIIDYNQQLGNNSTTALTTTLSNIDVRLCWRAAAFTDQNYLKIFTERSTPNSLNESLQLPDESYQILLYKNQPFAQVSYSAVIVQKTDTGYAVLGYNPAQPYFNILVSRAGGESTVITTAGTSVTVPTQYTDSVAQVPYGYVFNNRTAVCDFLLSYGQLLTNSGIVLEGRENGYIMDWYQMAQEFLYWSNQGWGSGALINLNPAATQLSVTKPYAVVNSLVPTTPSNIVLNQNRQPIPPAELIIDRLDNTFTVSSVTNNNINFVNLQFTAYEHLIVLDNTSIFADLIYQPITGARQSRVRVAGWLSGDWNGTVNAPGFVLNQDNIPNWNPNVKYAKGEIVLFKDEYWSAATIIQPSQSFDYNLWIKSDYNQIQKGLLPNASNVSDQLAQSYSVYDANLQREVDLFSFGLIGFRPRQYMQALNLDDVSQVNLYQQFLGSKGTIRSAELFSLANLGKETAEYNIYEFWAIQRGTYGANANRSYFELLLNETKLNSDPSLIQVVQPQEESAADQTVLVQDIWKSSYKIDNPNILPTLDAPITDTALPSAGYVNFNDVDLTLFDLEQASELTPLLPSIGIGTTIWVAKINPYDWGVYRCDRVPGNITQVADNFNGQAVVTFGEQHGLKVGDYIIIRYFSDNINGAYLVNTVPSLNTITITFSFAGAQTIATGTGVGFTLQTSRVAQPADIIHLPYALAIPPGAKVWVDNNGNGQWEVLEKTDPFVENTPLTTAENTSEILYGASIAQGFQNLSAMVGAPGYNPESLTDAPGAVYTYVKTDTNQYTENSLLELTAENTVGFGNAMDIGDQSWAVVGASKSNSQQGYGALVYRQPSSNAFVLQQMLVAPDEDFSASEFGYSVAISQNERWMYVGAPAANKVYAYARVPTETQIVSYITDGTQYSFNWSNTIVITDNNYEQFVVVLGNQLLTYGVDYAVSPTNVELAVPPAANRTLIITRRSGFQLDQQLYSNVPPDSISGTGLGATFNINRVRGAYYVGLNTAGNSYGVGDIITINATTIGGGTNPANDLTITVTNTDITGGITDFTESGSGVDNTTVFALDTYLATAVDIFSFTVTVDDQLYRPFIDYTYDGANITFVTVPGPAAIILVSAKEYFQYVDTLTVAGLELDARFGHSVATNTDGRLISVGTPQTNNATGTVYLFNRSVERFDILDETQTVFDTVQSLEGVTGVSVDGVYLINSFLNNNGQFTVTGSNQITLLPGTSISGSPDDNDGYILDEGDYLEIETNHFNMYQMITANAPMVSAQFGYSVAQCINSCSLYVGAPFDSTINPDGGNAEFLQNQGRVFGSITSTTANPTLTPGDYLSINNTFVEVTGTTVTELVADIIARNIPNATASVSADLELMGDNTTTVFDIGNIYSSAQSYTPIVYIGDVLQTLGVDYYYDNSNEQITFVSAPLYGSVITVVTGRITISVKNAKAAVPTNLVNALPGTGTVFADLGLEPYQYLQTILAPIQQPYANFGLSLFISTSADTLLVGAPTGSLVKPTTFDHSTTTFDATSLNFFDAIQQSGVVYSYDYLASVNPSVTNPPQFVFGQQIYSDTVGALNYCGVAIDYTTGTLLIGSPGNTASQTLQFQNINRTPAWQAIRKQQPVVDVNLLDTVYMYDRISSSAKQYFDYFDPLQGRLLGVVRENLNYIGAIDPASYNTGPVNNYGSRWGEGQVGQIWWNTNNVRFIDPNQDDIVYASRRWGQVFPGSTVDVYQWISSSVPPAQYAGIGTVLNTTSYVINSSINDQGGFQDVYYYWVLGINTVNQAARKTLSTVTIAEYINSPKSSGISYIAPINPSTIAIYNGLPYISAQDTVLYVEFDQQANDAAVHVEYQLIPQGREDGFLNAVLYRKFLDSFCGTNTSGALVPDPTLPPSERYGVEFRPRQSMFANRFLALQNYLGRANTVLAQYPIVESRNLNMLKSAEPEPTSGTGAWDKRVLDYAELTYQDLSQVSVGYRYLVASDSTNDGLWTIYEVVDGSTTNSLLLIRVQNYDTRKYWSYINWYLPGYNVSKRILMEVPTYSALATITVPEGSSVKVTANSQGKWEIYMLESGTWVRVALQDGTIEFSATLWDYSLGHYGFDAEVFDAQYFDQEPVIETRKILEAINQDLLIGDLLIERNNLLILMFNYILSEQQAPVWLTKTSMIDVDHTIRELAPFQIYRRDNQDFVLNYIQEVKPYHVQIKQFNLIYHGLDTYLGTVNDFDLPAYWDATQNLFISPVLDNTGTLSTTSSVPSSSQIWQTLPWNQWFQNYLLSVESITVVDGGTGYNTAPAIVVVGDCVTPAVLEARINSAGQVIAVTVVDPGTGYTVTPVIEFTSIIGSGARAVPVMGNGLVRNINTTIKYDRYQYQSTVVEWESNVEYLTGTLVRHNDRVWSANANIQSEQFDPANWTVVPAGSLSGVDRTMGYYVPDVNEPGLDLGLLISGINYPGVQVFGPLFSQNTGFDVGNYDINPFDNIAYGPEGRPTYDPAILDAIYESEFTDIYLGTRPTDINVDGGEFIDTYESHAPEELVPGAVFDTLDMRVFTTPGSDWLGLGHGSQVADRRYSYNSAVPTFNFDGLLQHPMVVTAFNVTTGTALEPTAYDWVNYQLTIDDSLGVQASNGDVIQLTVTATGGGNQLMSNSYLGNVIGDTIIIPFPIDMIYDFVIYNGELRLYKDIDYTWTAYDNFSTAITFTTTYGATDRINLTCLGYASTGTTHDWSLPVFETIYVEDSTQLSYELTNSLQGTNPINLVVTHNGQRARPYEGVRYIGTGIQSTYELPSRGGYSQSLIADNDISVYVDNEPLILGIGFQVDAWDGSSHRTVTLTTAPSLGSIVLVSVRTAAQYFISDNLITFRPSSGLSLSVGDVIEILTWNDTSQQDILTQVFVGPNSSGVLVSEGYSDTLYDEGSTTGEAGSYDFSTGTLVQNNIFDTGRVIVNPERILVTLNGRWLVVNDGYVIQGSNVVILGAPIGPTAVLAISTFTPSDVPNAIGFRIFQDMRGLQLTYRITDATTTELAEDLLSIDDTIYVKDASRLSAPNLERGIFGIITINGERITYRTRDTATNTLSGLRRGTAGTGAADHLTGTAVYDMGIGNLLPVEYQNRVQYDNVIADGTTTEFVAADITLVNLSPTELDEAVQVYVGGILQTTGYTVTNDAPVTVVFDTAPTMGYQVSIRVKTGLGWYNPGPSTPSNGVPLQETDTLAARFIRGE